MCTRNNTHTSFAFIVPRRANATGIGYTHALFFGAVAGVARPFQLMFHLHVFYRNSHAPMRLVDTQHMCEYIASVSISRASPLHSSEYFVC